MPPRMRRLRRAAVGTAVALLAASAATLPAQAAAAPAHGAAATGSAGDLTHLVNPFIGTKNDGNTYPGAAVPFGMVQLSPDTGHNTGLRLRPEPHPRLQRRPPVRRGLRTRRRSARAADHR